MVLGAIWLGGWWLFALVLAGTLVGLHEFYAMARPLRPLVLAGYGGAVAMLVGTELGGVEWMVGGFLATLVLGFLLYLVASTRAPATAAVSSTVLGVTWIGFGLGFLLLLRDLPEHGRLVTFAAVIAVWVGDTVAYLIGRAVGRHKFSPAISPAKTWEGFVAGTLGAIFAVFVALYDDRATFLSIPEALSRRDRRRRRGARRPARVGVQARPPGKGQRPPARRPWRRARSRGCVSLRAACGVLHRCCADLDWRSEKADRSPRRDRVDRAPDARRDRR